MVTGSLGAFGFKYFTVISPNDELRFIAPHVHPYEFSFSFRSASF